MQVNIDEASNKPKPDSAQGEGQKQFAKPAGDHVSLGRPIRIFLFFMAFGLIALLIYVQTGLDSRASKAWLAFFGFGIYVGVSALRVAAQWERAVVLRFGNLQDIRGPGLIWIYPYIDYIRFIDTRVLVLNVPHQKVITKDNVPAQIDGALFFKVVDPEKAIVEIQDFRFAISQYAQAALRDVVGGLSLDELLSEREHIQQEIGRIVQERIKDWGLHVDSIRLLDIELPEDLKRMMSRQASAEREKRATITKAEGDKLAAANLAEAALIMRKSPGAMQLRSLQTIDGLGPTASNTVVLFPADLHEAIRLLSGNPEGEKAEDQRAEAKPARAAKK